MGSGLAGSLWLPFWDKHLGKRRWGLLGKRVICRDNLQDKMNKIRMDNASKNKMNRGNPQESMRVVMKFLSNRNEHKIMRVKCKDRNKRGKIMLTMHRVRLIGNNKANNNCKIVMFFNPMVKTQKMKIMGISRRSWVLGKIYQLLAVIKSKKYFRNNYKMRVTLIMGMFRLKRKCKQLMIIAITPLNRSTT